MSLDKRESEIYAYVAAMRLRDAIAKDRNFECQACLSVLPLQKLGSLGTFVPNHTTMTTDGEKQRVAAYALCRNCSRKVGTQELAEIVERNIIAKGALLDPTHKKFEMPSEEDFKRWASDGG